MAIRTLLTELGLERYAEAFEANHVDEETLGLLDDADLIALGITSLGHRRKLRNAIGSSTRSSAGDAKVPDPRTRSLRRLGGSNELVAAPSELPASGPARIAPRDEVMAARGYTLLRRIGAGGMGEVHLARQESIGREVAIKFLGSHATAEDRIRFAREARAIATLQHPHVVRFFDYFEDAGGVTCIVMEHIEGASLSRLFKEAGRLPFPRVLAIAMQLCDALSEAHQKGIVHRDLKPSNVLLQRTEGYPDFVRVLDFGLAYFASETDSRLTRTGAVYGTPLYLAPEQILGSTITPRTDLYALGVILYEALAGRPPFEGQVDAAVLYRHLRDAPPPIPAEVERPIAFDALLGSLLAKSAALRPASAASVRRELAAMEVRTSRDSSPSAAPPPPSERRTIVVVDVAFTTPGRTADAARAAHTLVDDLARRMLGTIIARSDESVVMIFGAPVARRGDLERAYSAALELRTALSGRSSEADAESADAFDVRIGIADGTALTGGLREGGDYFASGPPLDEARSLSTMARPAEILVSRSLALRDLPEFRVDDVDEERGILVGVSDSSGRRARPFVGREKELDTVARVLDRARSGGTGAIVLVTGEAGIGKSRFVERALERAHARAMRFATGSVFEMATPASDDAVHQIVRELLTLPTDVRHRADAVERRLGPDSLRVEEWPFLYHFLGISLPGPMQRLYDAMDARARSSGYRDMLVSLFAHESRSQPLVLVLEDIHWADASTLELIELCADLTRRHPIVLVLTSRIEDEPTFAATLAHYDVTRLEVPPLNEDEVDALVGALGVDDEARRARRGRAMGHPLLLTELLRHEGHGGALPESVQELVRARVDRLPETDRAALAAAAVLGSRFQLADLRHVLLSPEYDPAALLDHRFVTRASEGTLAFTHDLVRQSVYDGLVADRARALHERASEAVAAQAAPAAVHLERAGSPKAARAFLDAVRVELGRNDVAAARSLVRRGLALASHPADVTALESERGKLELLHGDARAALEAFERALTHASAPAERVTADLGRAAALRSLNRWADAIEALERVVDAFPGPAELARAFHLRGGIEFARGHVAESQAAHERAFVLAKQAGSIELSTQALSGLADAHYGAGRLATAVATWQECVSIARRERLLAVEAANLPMLSIVPVFLGRPLEARVGAMDAIALAQSLSNSRAEAIARGGGALACAVSGDPAAALVHAERGRELVRRLGHVAFEETVLYYESLAESALGETARAEAAIDAALALARAHGMGFIGATLLAAKARHVADDAERRAMLAEGEALLAGGGLSFDRFWFHQNAIEAALGLRDTALVRRHAEAILRTEEPLRWGEHLAARARLLADAMDGLPTDVARRRAAELVAAMRADGFEADVIALEAWE